MAELEVRVVSERREGLLVELGRIISEHDHVLLRQRLAADVQGTCATLVLRGPDERRLALEDALEAHPRVLSLASSGGVALHASPVASSARAKHPASRVGGAEVAKIERILPNLAKDYPRIFPWLIHLEYEVAVEARNASLHLAGRRTGCWVYKRDYALGAKLGLLDAMRRIALPALREFVPAEQHGSELHLRDCPLCQPGGASGGHFFCGFLEGLLMDAVDEPSLAVHEIHCHSHGAAACVFEVSQ
ncbi:hypothetical protein [Dyella sp. ASV21]|jgi:hypothetical protein|uniref:hypothetical protein n=1 Tax=Dyella sp. ASV21 TaxID=2795114 RepID=UPI0018EBEC02|nr:hypothetical protein [Dyella sp. ASV21]